MKKNKKQTDETSQDSGTTKEQKEASSIHKWLTRIEVANKYKKKISEKYHWERLIEEFRGYFAGLQDSSDIYIPSLNDLFAYVKTELPALYMRNPKIKVNPKKGSSILSSKIIEKALNYLWRVKRLKRENRKNIIDTLLVGHSWFKTGYTGKFGTIEDGNGNTFEFIESEDFFGYRIPFNNITFNPDANDPPFDCTWICHEVWLPIDEVQENKTFKNTENLVPSLTHEEVNGNKDPLSDKNRFDPDVKMCKLYEVWDKKSMTVFTIAEGVDKYIREPKKWPYEMKGFPFSFLRFNDDLLCPYGIPDCYILEPMAIERMKIRATELDHLKRFNRQLLLAEGHMDADAKDQFSQGVTGAVIPVKTNGQPLSNVVMPIPYPPLPQDLYAIEDRIIQDMVKSVGQATVEQGATQKTSTRSLGEIQDIKEGSANRRNDKLNVIESFIEDIAYNLTSLLQQLADMPYFIRIAGNDDDGAIENLQQRPSAGQPNAVTNQNGFTFTKEDIQGEFDFEVVGGSTTPLDSATIMQILQSVLKTITDLQLPPGPAMEFIMSEIADELDMPGLKQAIVKEKQLIEQRLQAQQQQQQASQQAMVAQQSGELQIKAEREATKQAQLSLAAIDQHKPQSLGKENKVSESISFKDLPPEGQIQMAKQAGITLTPEQVQQLQDQQQKIALEKAKTKPGNNFNG